MRILFLDQSGKLGGAELCLADIAQPVRATSLVGVFGAGDFPDYLRQRQIPVQVLAHQGIQVRKDSGLRAGLASLNQLVPLIGTVTRLANAYDVIYANTPKALVVGAVASQLSGRPLVYHLHDIISADHFSATNRHLMVTLANRAALVIANSEASQAALIAAGGRSDTVHRVYNGFCPEGYSVNAETIQRLRQSLGLANQTVVGHFSRLSPWKGQDVLINALVHCPESVVALLVGDALFGEDDYVTHLRRLVTELNLTARVHFLGFRSDIPDVMQACDLVVHTSTAPEPFGRVIVEAMLSGKPVIAAAAGGALELVEHGTTGWLCPPGDPQQLARLIVETSQSPVVTGQVARAAQAYAQSQFSLEATNGQIMALLQAVCR
ncbi:MAG: glycosyltransferase family 4 protein [Nodosilinea sp.]